MSDAAGGGPSPAPRTLAALNRRIIACQRCPRLRNHCEAVARTRRRAFASFEYWGRPVPVSGRLPAPVLVVGLAPGAHGANRTGRMFTGDRSGDWLYRALHRAGLATRPESTSSDDGTKLIDCAITAAAHCAPPGNRPSPTELANCRPHLEAVMVLARPQVVVALGKIAWDSVVRLFAGAAEREDSPRAPAFSHCAEHRAASGVWLIASYHPSQQNTFTGRLTEPMLDRVFAIACRRAGLKGRRERR